MLKSFKSVLSLLAVAGLVVVGASYTSLRESDKTSANPKVDKLKLLPGFKAEHLISPSENGMGSWVSMTFDDKGRMLVSDQYGALYRLTLPPANSENVRPEIEKLTVGPPPVPGDTTKPKLGMGYAQGLLYAFNSLYVMVNNRTNANFEKGSGLYRLKDTDGNDQFDQVTLLKEFQGEGEHGPHAIILAPDGQSIYLIAGNFTNVPEMQKHRLPKVWNEDNLFPHIMDPRGHAVDRKAPGGWVARIDPEGQNWEFVAGGFRNAYDIAFNEAGDLFTFDSDMEWDLGMPWYKPTRICHITSGAEFGWRSSAVNWAPDFADALPGVLNMGQGSPTGVISGQKARFPEKYRKAIYAFDWSFGIMYALHMQPNGASYTATAEEFLSGTPLPLTDGAIGPDGSLYFLTGGRRLESDLYRVTYVGNENTTGGTPLALTDAQKLRRQWEQYHDGPKAGAVDAVWPYLNHPDRFIRYAARVGLEHQPVAEWQDRVLSEKDPVRLTYGAIALAHQGAPTLGNQLLASLTKVPYASLTDAQKQDLLRAIELTLVRMTPPDPATKNQLIAYLNPHYPAKTNALNRAMSKLLVHLEAPGVVGKTLSLLASAKDDAAQTATQSADLILRNPQYGLDIAQTLAKLPPAQQTYLAMVLSPLKTGWTDTQRETYFDWYKKAFGYRAGNSYIGFIDRARKMALKNVPEAKLAYFDKKSGGELLTASGNDLKNAVSPKGPGRNWKVDEAAALIGEGLSGRNFEQGQGLFVAVTCNRCHRMGGEGGDVGPDLTRLGTRFTTKDMLEAIIHPNKAISDQYAATIFVLKNGQSVLGRLINEDKTAYYVSQNPYAPDYLRKVLKKDVASTKLSGVSVMLPGLINSLNPEELKDLMAYLMAGGNPQNPVFTASVEKK